MWQRQRERSSEINGMIGHAKKTEPHLQGVIFHEKWELKLGQAFPGFREHLGSMGRDPELGESIARGGTFGELQLGVICVYVSVFFCGSAPSEIFFVFPFQTTRYGPLSFSSWLHGQNSLFPIQTCSSATPEKSFC